MTDLLSELHDRVFIITLNRAGKHNAFDDSLLQHYNSYLMKQLVIRKQELFY